MSWPRSWREFWHPQRANELNIQELAIALNSPVVRNHWLGTVLEELRRLNLEVDHLLDKGDPERKLIEISTKRRQIVSVLQQIADSKTSVELDRDHNQDFLASLAVEQAPGR